MAFQKLSLSRTVRLKGSGCLSFSNHARKWAQIRPYVTDFEANLQGFDADWSQIEQSNNDQLLATLSMVCPFEVAEKQALLEASDSSTRADLLIAMMEMALHEDNGVQDARH